MNHIRAFNALNAIARSPATIEWLRANDPMALIQVNDAIKERQSAGAILFDRLENIAANFGLLVPAMTISSEDCRGTIYIECRMENKTQAQAFLDFAKVFLHWEVSIKETNHRGCREFFVVFMVDED